VVANANEYEVVFIVNPALSEEDTNAVVAKVKELVETAGEVRSVDDWGKRKLAYPIKKCQEGYYVRVIFNSDSEFLKELDRICKLSDGIIRHMILRRNNGR